MTKLRQSVSWWCFAGHGVDDATLLRRIAAIGFEAVELIGEDHFARVQDTGLRIASHGGHSSIECGLNDPREHRRIEYEIRQNITLAHRHRIPNLIVFSGIRRHDLTNEQGIVHTADGLRRVTGAAEEAGVTLVLELLNSRVDHPGYQCDHAAWGVRVCERVGSPRVKMLCDIYHMQVMEGDVISRIRQNHACFAHYHTAGVPGRHDLDAAQELNYPAILRAVQETGYDGFMGHEFIPKDEPLAALQAAYDLCDISI